MEVRASLVVRIGAKVGVRKGKVRGRDLDLFLARRWKVPWGCIFKVDPVGQRRRERVKRYPRGVVKTQCLGITGTPFES